MLYVIVSRTQSYGQKEVYGGMNIRSLPVELVLKKYIVDLDIALNILLCKFIEILVKNEIYKTLLITTIIINMKFNTVNIRIHVLREIINHNHLLFESILVDAL